MDQVKQKTQVLKFAEGERGSITYLIQPMNSDLIMIKRDSVIGIDIRSESIRLKDRMNNLETLLNARCNIIEM